MSSLLRAQTCGRIQQPHTSERTKYLPASVKIPDKTPQPYFEKAALSRKANRKSQKLLLFVKRIENQEDVPIHRKLFSQVPYFGHMTELFSGVVGWCEGAG